jgi:hypothetical protein
MTKKINNQVWLWDSQFHVTTNCKLIVNIMVAYAKISSSAHIWTNWTRTMVPYPLFTLSC